MAFRHRIQIQICEENVIVTSWCTGEDRAVRLTHEGLTRKAQTILLSHAIAEIFPGTSTIVKPVRHPPGLNADLCPEAYLHGNKLAASWRERLLYLASICMHEHRAAELHEWARSPASDTITALRGMIPSAHTASMADGKTLTSTIRHFLGVSESGAPGGAFR